MASKPNMVVLQTLHATAELTAPAVALQHGSMQLTVALRIELHSRILRPGCCHELLPDR